MKSIIIFLVSVPTTARPTPVINPFVLPPAEAIKARGGSCPGPTCNANDWLRGLTSLFSIVSSHLVNKLTPNSCTQYKLPDSRHYN